MIYVVDAQQTAWAPLPQWAVGALCDVTHAAQDAARSLAEPRTAEAGLDFVR